MRELAKILGLNLVVAIVVLILFASYMSNPRPERILWPFVISLTFSSFIGTLAWLVLPKAAPHLVGNSFARWIQILGILSLISWAGGTMAYTVMVLQPFVDLRLGYGRSMVTCLVFTLSIGCITCIVEEARSRVQATTLQLKTRELERERALKAAAAAKLQSLESRIHPHFLFNTLNSISSLVRSNPAAAEVLIERLAALLRFSLDRHGNLVSLADEIQITRDYLDIEKARFGDRLRFSFEIPEDLLGSLVPAMSLQTLTENSVKYAVGAQRHGADLQIRAQRKGREIELAVTDTGPGFLPDSLPSGHGLDTLKQRLESHFGEAASLSTRRLEPGMEVAFRIPC